MCDFHSTAWRLIGEAPQMCHTPDNAHGKMIEAAGWKNNEHAPAISATVFEAEWDGKGQLPPDGRLVRNSGECPEKLMAAIRRHYEKLHDFLESGKDWKYFCDFAKWADVWGSLKSLPDNVQFPDSIDGNLYLRSLASLPDSVQFPDSIGGVLDLGSLTGLPDNVQFPDSIGGFLDLRSLTSLPDSVQFPDSIGGSLYLERDLKAQLSDRKKGVKK
jgi:hypothetical protein